MSLQTLYENISDLNSMSFSGYLNPENHRPKCLQHQDIQESKLRRIDNNPNAGTKKRENESLL